MIQRMRLLAMAAGVLVMTMSPGALAFQNDDPTMLSSGLSPQERRDEVVRMLNQHSSVAGSDSTKSYRIIFDAYLKMTEPPFPIGDDFNLSTIHSGMQEWSAVAAWAEENPFMADALLEAWEQNTIIVGLPYGAEHVPQEYRDAGIVVRIGMDGSLRNNEFQYMYPVEVISTYATAEVYRLLEADQINRGLMLAMAHSTFLRQLCDRDFLIEKLAFIDLLSVMLSNVRDVMYVYQDQISPDWFRDIAQVDIPFLNPDRSRLFMPEADRLVAEALIREVFDEETGRADPEQFAAVFGAIHSENAPLTRFGAARRWANIASVHGSLDASLERLKLVYDDWWRRWRVEGHDPILEIPTEFDRTNRVRYAAVIYSMQDIEDLFFSRDRLKLEVNGTSLAAGLCGYKQSRGTYPSSIEMTYAEFGMKSMNEDPYDIELGNFKYMVLDSRKPIDLVGGKRVWIESGEAVLWGRGLDYEDNRARSHAPGGGVTESDIVIWPAMKAVARAQGASP